MISTALLDNPKGFCNSCTDFSTLRLTICYDIKTSFLPGVIDVVLVHLICVIAAFSLLPSKTELTVSYLRSGLHCERVLLFFVQTNGRLRIVVPCQQVECLPMLVFSLRKHPDEQTRQPTFSIYLFIYLFIYFLVKMQLTAAGREVLHESGSSKPMAQVWGSSCSLPGGWEEKSTHC